MLSDANQKILRDIFYGEGDSSFYLMSMNKLKGILRKKKIKLPHKDVEDWYTSQEVVQVSHPPLPLIGKLDDARSWPIISWHPFQRLYADSIYFSGKKYYVMIGMDLFTRYGFAMKIKTPSSAKKSLQALKKWVNFAEEDQKLKVAGLYTDNGSEFQDVVQSWLKEKEIDHILSNPTSIHHNPPIERFAKTVRGLIQKHLVLQDILNQDDLDKIINGYNNSIHSSLGHTPHEVLRDKKIGKEIYHLSQERLMFARKHIQRPPVLQEGQHVRVFIRGNLPTPLKTQRFWSHKLYTVKGINKKKNGYDLNETKKVYVREHLLPIDKQLLDAYNYTPARKKVRVIAPRQKEREETKEEIDQRLEPERRDKEAQRRPVRINKDVSDVLEQPIQRESRERRAPRRPYEDEANRAFQRPRIRGGGMLRRSLTSTAFLPHSRFVG
jgi:hypothetical protein